MKWIGLMAMVLLCALNSGAQQKKVDSLHQVLSGRKPDTVRALALSYLSDHYKGSKPDSALYYVQPVLSYPDRAPFFNPKMIAYNAQGIALYLRGRYPDAVQAFKKFYDYASRLKLRPQMATALNNEGNIHIEMGEYGTALLLYKEALKIRQEARDSAGIVMSYNNIGFIYKDLGDYEAAVNNFLFALRMAEKLGDQVTMASSYNYLGIVFMRKKDYMPAISYVQQALALYRKLNAPNATAICLNTLANIYTEQGDYRLAMENFEKAREIYARSNDTRQLAMVNLSIGALYNRQEQYDKAFPYLLNSVAQNRQINNRRSLPSALTSAAMAAIHLKEFARASDMLDSAEAVVRQTKSKQDLKSLYEARLNYYQASGDYREAVRYAALYNGAKDSLLSEANIKSMTDMQVKYETEKKEQQITLLNKDNAIKNLEIRNQQLLLEKNLFELTRNRLELTEANLQLATDSIQLQKQREWILQQQLDSVEKERRIADLNRQGQIQQLELRNRNLEVNRRNVAISLLGALLLLGSLLGYSYYRRYRLRQEARMQAAILRQQELATRAVLEAEEGERQRIAKDLHDGVGQMMSAAKMNLSAFEHRAGFQREEDRLAFEKIISLVDESCREVRSVSHNMMPNALLKNSLAAAVREFIDKLDHRSLQVHLYTEGLDERLDSNTEAVLYRVIQECVNNVIKHSGADTLDITLIKDDKEITVSIEDNGQGFDRSLAGRGEGLGLKNIRTRVDYLKGSVDFDTAPGRGTVVAIHVPL
jgi:two-component system NarL family sensor kinase